MKNGTRAYIKGLWTRIRGLESDIRRRERYINNLHEEKDKACQEILGELIVQWKPHEHCQETPSLLMADLRAGDQVAIICRVQDTKTWLDEDQKPHSRANYHIIQTRKVTGFLGN